MGGDDLLHAVHSLSTMTPSESGTDVSVAGVGLSEGCQEV